MKDIMPTSKLAKPIIKHNRLERKYVVFAQGQNIEHFLAFHPGAFKQTFPPRQVNSLYFDTCAFSHYQASSDGNFFRVKPRIRWYNSPISRFHPAQLEIKIKRGELGNKILLPVKFNSKKLIKLAIHSDDLLEKCNKDLHQIFHLHFSGLIPTLFVSYTRHYFESGDGKVRLTVDQGLTYTYLYSQSKSTLEDYRTVFELKYLPINESDAQEKANKFPLVLARNSKYVIGLSQFF